MSGTNEILWLGSFFLQTLDHYDLTSGMNNLELIEPPERQLKKKNIVKLLMA